MAGGGRPEILKGLEAVRGEHRGSVLTIGNFDGIHIGHQKILGEVLQRARRLRSRALAITFEPHPVKVLMPERGVRILTPSEEKARLMGHFGMDAVLFINFSREFANLPAEDFIRDVLVGRLGARAVVVGHNYAFGRGKRGTTELLRRRGRKYGFSVKVVRNARIHGDVVSSSRIRSLLGRGRVCEASMFLGRPYMITGTVIKGAGRGGRLLDTPTANITTPNELVPREGVYAVKVMFDHTEYDGVANIGTNPTFQDAGSARAGGPGMSYEAHIFGFSGDLGGKALRVFFIDRIRDERTFPDAAALHEQIKEDIKRAKEMISRKGRIRLI
jgi:riboflavin kinase/FMN adenylyltransferase